MPLDDDEQVRAKRDEYATAPPPPSPPAPATRDPLYSVVELTTRVDALWAEWRRVEHEYPQLVRDQFIKGALRTAIIRAQRDAAHRVINSVKAIIADSFK